MKEIEVTISDFGETTQLFRELGFIEEFYQEQRRSYYKLDDISLDIDFNRYRIHSCQETAKYLNHIEPGGQNARGSKRKRVYWKE